MPVKNISNTRPMGKSALRNLERQRQMAQALQEQAMQPLRGGRMAGRVYVADSPMQGVAKLGQMLAGTYAQNKADERAQEIADDRRQDRTERVRAYLDDMRDTPKVAEQGNPYEIFTGPQYSQGTPEVHAVPPQGTPPNPLSSLNTAPKFSYGQLDDKNPYVPASEYQPATQGGELIGGNTHVPAQPAIAGLSREESAMKNLFTSDNPEMQELAMKMITGSGGFGGDSAIRTHQYFEGLSPEQRKTFMLSKRNVPYYDLGHKMFSPHLDDQIDKGIPPEKEPGHLSAAAAAKEEAVRFSRLNTKLSDESDDSRDELDNLNRLDSLIGTIENGSLAQLKVEVASILKSGDFNIDQKLGVKEAANALTIEMALGKHEEGTGPMTEPDFARFIKTVPGLNATLEGRKLISQTARKFAERRIEIAKRARVYRRKYGALDDRFLDELDKFKEKNPIFVSDLALPIPQGGKSSLIEGSLYKTPNGDLYWDGTNFTDQKGSK